MADVRGKSYSACSTGGNQLPDLIPGESVSPGGGAVVRAEGTYYLGNSACWVDGFGIRAHDHSGTKWSCKSRVIRWFLNIRVQENTSLDAGSGKTGTKVPDGAAERKTGGSHAKQDY
jgi:hypothetical protein